MKNLCPLFIIIFFIVGCSAKSIPSHTAMQNFEYKPSALVEKDENECGTKAKEYADQNSGWPRLRKDNSHWAALIYGPLGLVILAATYMGTYGPETELRENYNKSYVDCMIKRGYVITQAQTTLTTSEPESEEDGK